MNKDKIIERDLFVIFLIILLCRGKETYARRMLHKIIVIIGWMSLNNRNNANMNIMNGTTL
jgi:hypothetical protein